MEGSTVCYGERASRPSMGKDVEILRAWLGWRPGSVVATVLMAVTFSKMLSTQGRPGEGGTSCGPVVSVQNEKLREVTGKWLR